MEEQKISLEDLLDEDLINKGFFLDLLEAVENKKRILLVGQPGAHGLATLANALMIHGDTKGYKYEIFDSKLMGKRKGSDRSYVAHISRGDDIFVLLSLWASGDNGIATIYADSFSVAMDEIKKALGDFGIEDPNAFVNFTVDVISTVENEGDNNETSVVRDVIVLHH